MYACSLRHEGVQGAGSRLALLREPLVVLLKALSRSGGWVERTLACKSGLQESVLSHLVWLCDLTQVTRHNSRGCDSTVTG